MAGLAEDTLERPSAGRRIAWVVAVLAGLLLVGAAAWWLESQLSTPMVAKRQVARISILPDTPPPPPPPPPREEPKPQPRDDNKPPPVSADDVGLGRISGGVIPPLPPKEARSDDGVARNTDVRDRLAQARGRRVLHG